eukprot:3434410-Amphidinium_carterae.4
MVGLNVPWRQATERLDHVGLLLESQRSNTLMFFWNLPGFTSRMLRIDWFHSVDLGKRARSAMTDRRACLANASFVEVVRSPEGYKSNGQTLQIPEHWP